MRKPSQRILVETRRHNGLCLTCGQERTPQSKSHCERHRQLLIKKRRDKRANGICTNCGNRVYVDRARCHKCRILEGERTKRYSRNKRRIVLDRYGGKCMCCGESQYEFLTIDHINNDGAAHRKSVGNNAICLWLIRNNFPDGFQVLCWNCNAAKQFHSVCPHQTHKPTTDDADANSGLH